MVARLLVGACIELLESRGGTLVAPTWPGEPDTVEEARANPDLLADHGVEEVANHYAKVVEALDRPAVLVIGHSFGGLIAEKLLSAGVGAAAIAIDAAQIKGVLPLPISSLRATFPVFKSPGNKPKAVADLTADQFAFAFGNAVLREESDELYERWAIPRTGPPAVRGGHGQLRSAPADGGRHQKLRTRPAASRHGWSPPHSA